jgi:energy-coupling factor transporter ATP-binding protein EcfA2
VAVRVERLSFRYPGGAEVLKEISFSIAAGETVALVGPSGAGKSTLLQHLNGLLPGKLPEAVPHPAGQGFAPLPWGEGGRRPGEGSDLPDARSREDQLATRVPLPDPLPEGERKWQGILIDNIPVTRQTVTEVRRRVGFLFQDPDDQLCCPTVFEDVAFGPLNLGLTAAEVRQRVRDSLAAVGLAGYEPRSTLRLSLGERKRVCLAGVFACQPSILALDEPFSSLDPRARRTLIDILKRFPGSQIITTHDLDTVVDLCDRVLLLDGGILRADGPTADVLGNAPLMDRHGLEVPWRLRTK